MRRLSGIRDIEPAALGDRDQALDLAAKDDVNVRGTMILLEELNDSVSDAAKLVKEWRQKMIKHLSVRGEPWVRDGDLVVQTTPVRRRANNPIVMR